MTIRPIRYIVQNPDEAYSATYSAALGKDALTYALYNAKLSHGKVLTELADGTVTVYKSFERED